MESDIVERLRSTGGLDAKLLCAAADEIERLRAELRTYTGDGHTLGEHLAREAT